jgi:hypothetical protein
MHRPSWRRDLSNVTPGQKNCKQPVPRLQIDVDEYQRQTTNSAGQQRATTPTKVKAKPSVAHERQGRRQRGSQRRDSDKDKRDAAHLANLVRGAKLRCARATSIWQYKRPQSPQTPKPTAQAATRIMPDGRRDHAVKDGRHEFPGKIHDLINLQSGRVTGARRKATPSFAKNQI